MAHGGLVSAHEDDGDEGSEHFADPRRRRGEQRSGDAGAAYYRDAFLASSAETDRDVLVCFSTVSKHSMSD